MAIRPNNLAKNYNMVGVFASAAAFLTDQRKSAAVEGDTYYDTTLNILRTYDGASWSNAGANSQSVGSLHDAATVGAKVTGLALEIEGTDAAIATNGALLLLDNDDTGNDVHSLEITQVSTAPAIQITNDTATTDDIQGTGDSWAITGQGNADLNSVNLADGKFLNLGSSDDITVQWDSTDLLIEGAATNSVIKVGATNNLDVIIYGDTATDNVTFDTSAELMALDGFDLLLEDADLLKFGDGSDVTINWDGSNLLIEAETDNVGQIRVGSTNAMDLALYGSTNTKIALFDVSAAILDINDWDVRLQDADSLFFGDASDITIQWDGTDLLIDGETANTVIKVGAVNNQNLMIYGATTTNYIEFDTDDTAKKVTFEHFNLELHDDSELRFGDLAAGDIVMKWDGTDFHMSSAAAASVVNLGAAGNVLNITQHGTITVGVDDTGYDVKFFGATASAYMLWDESVDDLILAGAAGLSVAGATTLTGAVTATTGVQAAAVERTVTETGETTGTIADGTSVVTVVGANANHILVLPTPTPGNIVWLLPNATGYELRSSAPDTVAINGGTGASAESAIAAGVAVRAVCTSATTWVCTNFAANGTVAATEVAA